ncbi:MAG: LptF/LptG family permease [Candidatus Sericytochromatia bacterium]
MSPSVQTSAPKLEKYLSQCRKHLHLLPATEREEILRELQSHCHEEQLRGRDLDNVLQRLGSPTDYTRPFVEQYTDALRTQDNWGAHAQFALRRGLGPALAVGLIMIVLFQANTLVMFAELLTHAPNPLQNVLQLMLYSMPAVVSLALPYMALLAVPTYLYRLRGAEATHLLNTASVWKTVLVICLLLSGLGLAVQEWLVPPANRQTVALLKDMMQAELRAAGSPAMTFQDNPDVRTLNFGEAARLIERSANTPNLRRLRFDFYTKITLPLAALSNGLYGMVTAMLMVSGLFQPLYTLVVMGVLVPSLLWFILYGIGVSHNSLNPLLGAVLPNSVILGIAVVFLLGIWLQQRSLAKAVQG